jgi:hypothetical protein
MSGAAGLDLRYPIGGLFVVLGLILAGYGLATADDAVMYARATAININLWWGLVMLGTGILFLLLARRGSRLDAANAAMHSSTESPAGRDTERRERDLGLEG